MLRIATIILLLLPAPAFAAKAADPYSSLKPLIGTWLVDRECKAVKDKLLVEFVRLSGSVLAEFRNPTTQARVGRADIFAERAKDHFRIVTTLPDNPVLKALNMDSVTGSLVVSDDPDEPDGPGKDYLTSSTKISMLTALATVKLRSHYKKATFLFTTDSPLGKEQCRGTASKQPAPKK
jgi:hypothetical protein